MRKFQVAAVFSDNMVLQREKNVRIFGQGQDLSTVSLDFMDRNYTTIVKDGNWFIILPPMSAGDGYDMHITCNEESITFHNIAIGEVYLAGGQSNMEMELRNCKDGVDMLHNDKEPNVRYYYTMKNAVMNEDFYEMEEKSCWSEFSEENAKTWSGVAYIFGKRLAKELGVTVGIIGCNWGGTSGACWVSIDALQEDMELNTYIEEYEKAIEGTSELEQMKAFNEYLIYHEKWEKDYAKLQEDNPEISWEEASVVCGECKWPGPMTYVNPYRPSGLYECMIKRIVPYTLRGFIYYQGESDDHRPHMYQKLLTRLIKQWRDDFLDGELPFLFVQLPMHRYKADPDKKNWCLIREAQINTFKTIKNTGIAVCIDCGEFNEIHPKDKTPVGERLALQALHHVYHIISDIEAFGPMYKSHVYKEKEIELTFKYAKDGFILKGEGSFEIAGIDEDYKIADIRIEKDKIYVSSQDIDKPVHVRYCWTNFGEVTVYGKNKLPLAPFQF